MTRLCAVCGNEFRIEDPRNQVFDWNIQLCSVNCFIGYVMSRPNSGIVRDTTNQVKILSLASEKWDEVTKSFYRSEYEILIARSLLRMGEDFLYEKLTITIGNDNYTPDFYLTRPDLFLEVKGVWSNGSKKKLTQAVRYGYPILLLPWYMEKLFRKRENEYGFSLGKTSVSKARR